MIRFYLKKVRYDRTRDRYLWGAVFALITVGGFQTYPHLLAQYYGDSIFPKQADLEKKGPYSMSLGIGSVRNGPKLVLTPIDNSKRYIIDAREIDSKGLLPNEGGYYFDPASHRLPIEYTLPKTYVWVYEKNPIREVWKIDFENQEILSFKLSVLYYSIKTSDIGFYFLCPGILLLLYSLVGIKSNKSSMQKGV